MTRTTLVFVVLSATAASAGNEFQTGCERGATEVLCAGHDACHIRALVDQSKNGLETEKNGEAECKALAKAGKAKGLGVESKRAIKSIEAAVKAFNASIAKDFPFVKLTVDVKRLELEDVVRSIRGGSRRGLAAGVSPPDSDRFQQAYLNPIKTALYNVAKDDVGRDFLKERLKEIRLGFRTHGGTSESLELRATNGVLVVPGIYSEDSTGYAGSVQQYLEQQL